LTTDDKLNAMQAVTAVLAGIFIGVALADSTTSEFWLYRYQTILAGILAIVAAGWTVVEMRRSDDRQERRHGELVKLGVRADGLKAARAAHTFPGAIRTFAKVCDQLSASVASWSEGLTTSEINDLANAANALSDDIQKTLSFKAITDARDIFDGATSSTYEAVLILCGEISSDRIFDIETNRNAEERLLGIERFGVEINDLSTCLHDLADQLERQSDGYHRSSSA
jgi:hypothetical protein